jgi:hypothetical protein
MALYRPVATTALVLALAACGDAPVAATGRSDAGATASNPQAPRTSAVRTSWVYHDGRFLWPGDYSFAAKPDYGDKQGGPLSGRYDIKVVTERWGGFLPFAPNWDFDLRPYAYLTFALKPTVSNQVAQVFFEKVGDVQTGKVLNPFLYGPAPVAGQWGTYKIPLADFGVAGIHIYKFAIQDQTGLPSNVFYLDDIGFLPPDP